jgi:transcriptional regulator with XRE-family HTH domain
MFVSHFAKFPSLALYNFKRSQFNGSRIRHFMSSNGNIYFPLETGGQWQPLDSMVYNEAVPSARDPEAVYRVFGRRLREIREKKSVPQQELATFSGLTRSSIANIESGKQRVLLHQVLQFAAALRVAVGELVPSPAEMAQTLTTDTGNEKNAYLEKLRRLASGRTEEEGL